MKKKYLITGGLGFIGRAIAKDLIKKNNSVVVLDNKFRDIKSDELDYTNCKIYKSDIRDKRSIKKAIKNIDVVVHLAFVNGTNFFYDEPKLVLDVALKGIINMLEICQEYSIPEFFLASSSEVYQEPPYYPADEKVPLSIPDPLNPRYSYAAGKIISEILLLNTDFFKRFVIFRPHNIYGPNMGYNHVIPEIIKKVFKAKKNLTIQGSGNHTRSFCYIDDFLKGFNLLLKKGKHKNIYNIGTEDELKIINLIKKIISISEKKLTIKKTKEKLGNVARRYPDIGKIKKLGYNPKTNLDNGLKKTFNWYYKSLNNAL